jgi:hypothetical protein
MSIPASVINFNDTLPYLPHSSHVSVHHSPFLVFIPKKELEAYEITMLSVRLSPTNNVDTVVRSSWNPADWSYHWRWPQRLSCNPTALSILKWRTFKLLKVDAKLAPVSLGLWRIELCNHANQAIFLWELCNNTSHSWTHYLTTATMVGDVTMETEQYNLPYLT